MLIPSISLFTRFPTIRFMSASSSLAINATVGVLPPRDHLDLITTRLSIPWAPDAAQPMGAEAFVASLYEHPTVRAAADVLLAGQTVAFPTETVYGLGANALDNDAVAGIYSAKGRPSDNPLIVHVARPSQLADIADGPVPASAATLAARFWPGPLSIIVRSKPGAQRRLARTAASSLVSSYTCFCVGGPQA